jgi:hypothetical protein
MTTDHAVVESLSGRVRFIHEAFLDAVGDLDEGSFRARPGAKAPSIAFHLWHTARWADAFQARFGTFAPDLARFAGREQLWDVQDLANAWHLGATLGKEATGMGLDDDASAAIRSPRRTRWCPTRERVRRCREVFAVLDEDEFRLPTADFYDEGGWVVIDHFGWHLTHASRHLGMIEALKGVLGVEGTATV